MTPFAMSWLSARPRYKPYVKDICRFDDSLAMRDYFVTLSYFH